MSGKLAIFAAMGGAHALAAREAGCSLTFTTGGAVSYPVGQHSSGQTRAGSSLPATTFTYENTTLTDSQGRGCWWTPPATVLQCDVGQIPETGFEIGCDGSVSYNGQTTFYECLTGDSDEVNIYRLPDQGSNCAEITLTASGCYSSDCSGGNNSGSQSATAAQPTGSSQGYSTAPASTPTQSTGAGSTPAYQTASTKAESTSAYSATTQVQSKPDQSTQTPATPIVSTIYSTTMVTISSCGPEVSSCPAASTPAPVTETVYSTAVVTVSGPAGECTPGTVSVPFTETETQPVPTTTQTSQATIPVYETSVQTTTKASTIETTATQSTHVTVPVYSTSIATESTKITETQKTQSTVPVYSTSVATQSTKTTATEKTQSTVPVYSTSVATQKTESTVPVYSTSVATTKATQSVETSVPVYPTTLSQKTSQPATSASSTPATTQSTTTGVTVPSPSTVSIPSSCPANGVTNAGEFNLPSLIIVTDKSSPNTANGTQYFGDITPTRSTVFNFDIPASDAGKTCELSFLFPEKDTLETSTYTFSGSGALDFYKLSSAATQSTSYSNAPSVESDLGQFTVSPGNAYTISSFACPSGSTISIEISDVSGGDTNLYFFQDYNPCPLGLFITTS